MRVILSRLIGRFSVSMSVDLGTANTLVYLKQKGIVINEPSVVAVNTKTNQILAIGKEAQRMVGKTPAHIVALRPLKDGVISNFEITERMLHYFITKVQGGRRWLAPPRVVIGIPSGCTAVEKKSVKDAALSAGAREVFLIEEPMAAAIGARLPVQEAAGCMIVDIGGGTSEVSVISLGGIVISRSLRVAGDQLNKDLVHYARTQMNILIGERTAEQVKLQVGSAFSPKQKLKTTLRGRDLLTGLPKQITITDAHTRQALARSVKIIVQAVRSAVEDTPPELLADIMKRGIWLAGGGSLLKGLPELIQSKTHIPTRLTEDPLTAVARGTGMVLEQLERYREMTVEPDE